MKKQNHQQSRVSAIFFVMCVAIIPSCKSKASVTAAVAPAAVAPPSQIESAVVEAPKSTPPADNKNGAAIRFRDSAFVATARDLELIGKAKAAVVELSTNGPSTSLAFNLPTLPSAACKAVGSSVKSQRQANAARDCIRATQASFEGATSLWRVGPEVSDDLDDAEDTVIVSVPTDSVLVNVQSKKQNLTLEWFFAFSPSDKLIAFDAQHHVAGCCCTTSKNQEGEIFIGSDECTKRHGTCTMPLTKTCQQDLAEQNLAEQRENADKDCRSGNRKDCDGDGSPAGIDPVDTDPTVTDQTPGATSKYDMP
jgi:hypothetical protein